MESHTKFMGHPLHPMLIVLPLGLFITAVIFDVAYLVVGNSIFSAVAFYNISIGIMGGLLAAIFGFRDWLAIPADTRAKRIGAWHGLGNVVVVTLFLVSWLMRRNVEGFIPSGVAVFISVLAVLFSAVTGWLGGELVDRLGVGVDHGANLDASSSLSHQPAMSSLSAVPVTGGEKYQEKLIQKNSVNEFEGEPKDGTRSEDDIDRHDPMI